MAANTQLSVTTTAGTTTVTLGNGNKITIDSPGGAVGTPAAAIRTPHTFAGFKQWGPNRVGVPVVAYVTELAGGIYPAGRRVSGLSYAAGVITVSEAGTPTATHPSYPNDPWAKTTNVSVDDASNLVIDGGGLAPYETISLKGLSAISLTEAA
jgi:hypothetical protein